MTLVKRNTWQREAVRDALSASNGFVSAQQLHQTLRERGSSIGLATVYRALASLADQDEADCLQSPDGEQLYRSCSTTDHHHHLICRGCGKTVEIEAADMEAWTHAIAATHGFSDVTHVLDIFGLCTACAEVKG